MRSILFAVTVLAAITTPATTKELSSADIRKLFPGSYSLTIFNSFTLKVTMRSNGVMTGFAKGRRDTGRWTIEGKQLCIAWNTWTKGRKGCSVLTRENGVVRGRGFSFKA